MSDFHQWFNEACASEAITVTDRQSWARLAWNERQAELDRLHAENETLRRLLQRAVDFEEGTRLPHWATPGWVADSIEEIAKAKGGQT